MQKAAHSRTGWAPEETELLWEEIRRAGGEGYTLKGAFDTVAQKTGRRPNSIRNYYYQSIKDNQIPGSVSLPRAQPFVTFEGSEVKDLLRQILTDRARGISVRACVQRLGGGDRALTLRYQNKYRSILKSHPEWIHETIEELRQQGIDCPNPYDAMRKRRQNAQARQAEGDGLAVDADLLVEKLRALLHQDQHQEGRRHREELDRMSVRCDLLRLELVRREEEILKLREGRREILGRANALMAASEELLSGSDAALARQARDRMAELQGALGEM